MRSNDLLGELSSLPPLPRHVDGIFICPRGGNTGDDLIRRGCLSFLRSMGLDVWESDGAIEHAALTNNASFLKSALSTFRGFIFFTGGGNVGIYRDNEIIRKQVIEHATQARGILVFPQSCMRPEEAFIHPRVTVWAREADSFSMLRSAKIDTDLVPDAALFLDPEFPAVPHGEGVFFIRRGKDRCDERVEHEIRIEAPTADLTYDQPISEIVSALKDFKVVVSDRLHGGIISLAMRKRTAWLPVRYHKIRSFFETWFAQVPGISFVDNTDALNTFLSDPTPPSINPVELFLSRAVPSFVRFLEKSGSGPCRTLATYRTDRHMACSAEPAVKLVAISRVKNEIDIIEAFVRHTLRLVDKMLVMDDGSTDGTGDVLRSLVSTGLPIEIISEDSIGNWQRDRMTRLMRIAVIEHNADWVIPLDADEFLSWSQNERSKLTTGVTSPFIIPWRTYVPTLQDDENELNPVLRIRHRLSKENATYYKVLVPRLLALDSETALEQGNHGVTSKGEPCHAQLLGEAFLAHLPVRSAGQIGAKISIGRLQYLLMDPKRVEGQGFHYIQPFQDLKRDPSAFASSIGKIARHYGTPEGSILDDSITLDPIRYQGAPLIATPSIDDRSRAFQALLTYSEKLCIEYRDINLRLTTLMDPLPQKL
jgi:exopolysaccharide biosynthesis predicted pyruvyltransferase EpsI